MQFSNEIFNLLILQNVSEKVAEEFNLDKFHHFQKHFAEILIKC